MAFTFFGLFDGDTGITQTVNVLRKAVDYAIHVPEVRARAESIVASCPERDENCEIKSIFSWVQNHYRYLKDPRGIEFIKSPEIIEAEISKQGFFQGDCDDVVGFMAALFKSIGYQVRAVVITLPGSSEYRHVYLEVLHTAQARWIGLEQTARHKPMGWTAGAERRRAYDL